jgi:uncharacterized membrane protein YcaP (DUF421 family)
MYSFEIHLEDWKRILFGIMPGIFYLEVFLRITFIYLLIIFCLRLMGKRMAAKVSRNELLALSALAASIGMPLQEPDRGMLPAIIVAMVVVIGQRTIALISTKSQRLERQSQGDLDIIITDGYLQIRAMRKARLSRERVFAQLRSEGIIHLGQVKRLYFEASGSFSMILNKEQPPGLSIIPESDCEYLERQQKADVQVCNECGKIKESDSCDNCKNTQFQHSIA